MKAVCFWSILFKLTSINSKTPEKRFCSSWIRSELCNLHEMNNILMPTFTFYYALFSFALILLSEVQEESETLYVSFAKKFKTQTRIFKHILFFSSFFFFLFLLPPLFFFGMASISSLKVKSRVLWTYKNTYLLQHFANICWVPIITRHFWR